MFGFRASGLWFAVWGCKTELIKHKRRTPNSTRSLILIFSGGGLGRAWCQEFLKGFRPDSKPARNSSGYGSNWPQRSLQLPPEVLPAASSARH